MTIDTANLLAIFAMAVATYITRIAGVVLLRYVTLTPRIRSALDALPVAVLTAVITPVMFLTGPAETLAGLITALAAFRLPLLGVLAVGAASIVCLRLLIG
jgi:uncharacterized membrane protein